MSDLKLAKKYLSKAQSAKSRGIKFTLSFTSFKNLMRANKCYYTGLPFVNDSDKTIDRVDRTKGYQKGNVVACHDKVNRIKNVFEQPSLLGLEHKDLFKMLNKWEKH